MSFFIWFDFAAAIAFAGMIFAVIYRRTTSTFSGKFFLMMLIVGFFSAIFDILSVNSAFGLPIMYLANLGYLACRAFSALSFCFYIIGITDNWHKFKNKPLIKFLIFIPFLIIIGLLASNYWTKFMFTVTDGIYKRGPFINWGAMYWCTLFYLITGIVYGIKYRSFFSKDKFFAIVFIYPIGLVSLIIQMVWGNMLVEVFFSAVASYLIMVIVERPEEYFEPEIGLKKYTAFANDANKAMVTKKKVSLVFVKIVNEQTLNSQLSYQEVMSLRKSIGNVLKSTAADFSMHGEYYWLGQGQYAAVLSDLITASSDSFAMTLRRRLNVPLKCDFGIIDVYSNVALIRCPEDISSSDGSLSFIDSFYHISNVLPEVLDMSTIPNKREFEMKMEMDSIIKKALLNHGFEVYFQPIYSVKDKSFTRAEALLRLKDPKYGFIPPSIFITQAERNGMIHKIGDFVFDAVASFIASDDFSMLNLEFIEVNLSVAQCMHEDLAIRIMDAVKKYGISPSKISLEITESNDAYSQKMMSDNIKILKDLGFAFSLDDYGSGYSSIDTVSSLPLDMIKLDKNIVDSSNPEIQIMVEHYIKMIKDLKRKIVVEGVETKETLDQFENYLCDYIQGFYFSKPLPKKDFVEFIKKNKETE